jgi:hypothetical protein
MPTGTLLAEFARVSDDFPCPVCGRGDWCMISHDGWTALCQRVESKRPWQGRKGFVGYAHLLTKRNAAPPPTAATPALSPEEIEYRAKRALANCSPRRLDRFAASLGVTRGSLERLEVGWNRRLGCFTFPMRDAQLRYTGIRYRFSNGEKRSLKGASDGLFIPRGVLGQKFLFFVEGPTDCAAVLDCGLPAIGRPNNRGGVEEILSLVRRYRPPMVVIIDDADQAGVEGGDWLQQSLTPQELSYRPIVKRIRPARFKDARETVRAGGRRQTIIGALEHRSNHYWVAT